PHDGVAMIGRGATRRWARPARIVAPVSSLALLIVSCALGLNLVEPGQPDPVAFAAAVATATRTRTPAADSVADRVTPATPTNAISVEARERAELAARLPPAGQGGRSTTALA